MMPATVYRKAADRHGQTKHLYFRKQQGRLKTDFQTASCGIPPGTTQTYKR